MPPNTITIKDPNGANVTIPLDVPPPTQHGNLVGYTEQDGLPHFVRDQDVLGWQWDGKTHQPRGGGQ